MNTNLLMEDEQDIYDSPLGLSLKDVDLLISRLCKARAEKYEFAAQQLEKAAADCLEKDSIDDHWQRFGLDVANWLRERADELRRLANG